MKLHNAEVNRQPKIMYILVCLPYAINGWILIWNNKVPKT